MANWQLYTGTRKPHVLKLPKPPPWRRFGPVPEQDDPPLDVVAREPFLATEAMVEAVNAALLLRRPLLLTGLPGSGKSSLVASVARELRLGPVLRWNVTSRSTLTDALYRYDAIARLQDHRLTGASAEDIGSYLRLGPLGTALLPRRRPRALLIDEIDKSDVDLPNDLLNVFERGEFEIPELARHGVADVEVREDGSERAATITRGFVRCAEFPFVVLTSNGERDFPAAFLRRCIRLQMPDPDPVQLARIIEAHLGATAAKQAADLIGEFAERAKQSNAYATDQLMNAVHILTRLPEGDDRDRIIELLLKELNADLR